MDRDVAKPRKRKRPTGLANWMEQVLVCHTQALLAPDVRAVHQLRKALRRCRTLAGALREVDPTPEWRAMLKASRTLFKALGGLRDTHVLVIWLDRLAPVTDASGRILRYRLNQREVELTAVAREALDAFDRDAWKQSIEPLAVSATHHPPGDPLFEQLTMRRLLEAHQLHLQALESGNKTAWHDLRIGIKRLRYAIENFLPDQHTRWGDDLGLLQEALGDVHDLDVLWDELLAARLLGSDAVRQAWRQRLDNERNARLASYRQLMTGPDARWQPWHEELLAADRVETANRAALEHWGAHHGSDPVYAAWLVEQFEALLAAVAALPSSPRLDMTRRLGVTTALLHGVAGPANDPVSRKRVHQRIAELPLPIGWDEVQRNACSMVLAGMRRRRLESISNHPEINAAAVLAARLLGLLDALASSAVQLPKLAFRANAQGLTYVTRSTTAKAGNSRQRLAEALGVPVVVSSQ